MTIGAKIRHHRKQLGLTQTELGEKLGVKTNAVSKWECGRVEDIPTSKIKAMSILFGVPTSYLIDEDVPYVEKGEQLNRPLPQNLEPLPRMRMWSVLGATACGTPLHRELLEETVLAPDDIKADVVFRCVGDSMINARIFDGDAVFVRTGTDVENGQIAVVRVGDEYTLKRVYVYEDYVELRAENPMYQAIILRGNELQDDNFEVVGLAVAFLSSLL